MEPVVIRDYDPQWPRQFEEVAARVRAAFAGASLADVEHVGSTAVPGLAAKPIIDLDVVIPSEADLPDAVSRLATLGYVYEGDNGIPGRAAFLWPPGTPRHHLYVCASGNPELRRHLAFRDYLRANPEEAHHYGALKRELAQRFREDRRAYSGGKTEFVETVLTKAEDEIALVAYDPHWPEQFAHEAARVRAALGDDLVLAVEHFGSTAVPGLVAKPVIDLLVGVRSVAGARERAVAPLEALGYSYWRDNPNPGHLFLVKGLPPNGPRTHHIHMVEPGAFPDPKNEALLFWDRLLFRDYLRAHPDEARRYESLKRALAARHPGDRDAYTEGKTEYVYGVMQRARARPSE